MARQLIEHLSAEWEPEKYTDEYQDNLMRVIKAKLKGKKPKLQEHVDTRQAEVMDLMARLRASLEGKEKAGRNRQAAGRHLRRQEPRRARSVRSAPAAGALGCAKRAEDRP